MKVIVTGNARSGSSFITNLIHIITNYHCGPPKEIIGGDKNNKWGYWEHSNLNKHDRQYQRKIGADFFNPDPTFSTNIDDNKFIDFANGVKNIVNRDNIELYKNNTLMISPQLYQNIFPNVKWVYTERPIEDAYRSRFGAPMDKSSYESMVKNRIKCWKNSPISKDALTINYTSFEKNIEKEILKISNYLEIKDFDMNKAVDVYKPKR